MHDLLHGPRCDEFLAVVSGCPDRGSVLPHTLQTECCRPELTECRRFNRGVTTDDCLWCKAVAFGVTGG